MLTNRSTKGGQKQMLKAAALGELVLPTSSWEGLPDEPASEHTGTPYKCRVLCVGATILSVGVVNSWPQGKETHYLQVRFHLQPMGGKEAAKRTAAHIANPICSCSK